MWTLLRPLLALAWSWSWWSWRSSVQVINAKLSQMGNAPLIKLKRFSLKYISFQFVKVHVIDLRSYLKYIECVECMSIRHSSRRIICFGSIHLTCLWTINVLCKTHGWMLLKSLLWIQITFSTCMWTGRLASAIHAMYFFDLQIIFICLMHIWISGARQPSLNHCFNISHKGLW